MFAANYAFLHGLKTITFDSLNEVGGQPQMLYPFKTISDIPVFSSIESHDLISRLKEKINEKTTLCLNHKVNEVDSQTVNFIIDAQYEVRSILITTGNGAFKPKKFPLKTNDPEINHRIHYFVQNPNQFSHQEIGIFGGGDSALDFALELAQDAQIAVIHRRNQFRGLETSVNKLKSLKNAQILTPYLPKTIELADNKLRIGLKEVGTDRLLFKDFDQIIVAYGFRADNRFVKNWGIELTQQHIQVDRSMQTNLAGIYAAGDAATYPGRVPIIGIGFGEVQIAINAIMQKLFPEKNLTIHSTSL